MTIGFWFDSIQIERLSDTVKGNLNYWEISEARINILDPVTIMDYWTNFAGSYGSPVKINAERSNGPQRGMVENVVRVLVAARIEAWG